MKSGLKVFAAIVSIWTATASAPASAALITQSWSFDFDYTYNIFGSSSPSYSSVAGTVAFTYDNATSTSLLHQAVDSASFTTPTGLFHTSNLFFDLRLGPDLLVPTNSYEFSIYFGTEGVAFADAGDWLIRMAGIGLPGDPFVFGSSPVAAEFLSGSGNLGDPVIYRFAPTDPGDFVGTTAPVGGVPVPGSLALLGLGLAGAGLAIRRRGPRASRSLPHPA